MRLILVTLVLTFATLSQAQASYPFVCRGGKDFKVDGTVSIFTIGGKVMMNSDIMVYFKKATRPGGPLGENLGPGECAWVDRPLNANEPAMLSDRGQDHPIKIVTRTHPKAENRIETMYAGMEDARQVMIMHAGSDGKKLILDQSKGVLVKKDGQ